MLTRFNFYDVYGYLIPGVVIVGLAALPFWTLGGLAPSGTLAEAFIGLVGAYVAGHLIQELARQILPTARPQDGRMPSDYLLDPSAKRFSTGFKKQLAARVEGQFGIKLELEAAPAEDESRTRNSAVRLCRDRLSARNSSAGPDQLEGMYALHRGMAAAFGLVGMSWLGWFVGSSAPVLGRSWVAGTGAALFGWLLLSWLGRVARPHFPKKLDQLLKLCGTLVGCVRAARSLLVVLSVGLAGGSAFLATLNEASAAAWAGGSSALAMLFVIGPIGAVVFLATAAVASTIGSPSVFLAAFPLGAGLLTALFVQSADSFRRFSEEFVAMTYRSFVALDSAPASPRQPNQGV